MPVSSATITKIAQSYLTAIDQQQPITPVASFYSGLTMEDAYRVQQEVVARFAGQGHRVVGMKAAATSATAQAKMNIAEPIYGQLFDFQRAQPGATLAAHHFIQPLIECELAFVLARPLTGPGITVEAVLAATDYVMAAFDIIDFRTREPVGMPEALCSNVYAAHFVLGEDQVAVDRLDLPNVGIALRKNGETITTAVSSAIMGHPAHSVAWLANKLAEQGRPLVAGEFALTGAITQPQPIAPGDHFEATFDGLGSLEVRFI